MSARSAAKQIATPEIFGGRADVSLDAPHAGPSYH
jgi:hypothetical protein